MENLITNRTTKGGSVRSQLKTLYIARDGAWWKELKKEMQKLEERISRTANTGSRKQKVLWLPTVIENPSKVRLHIYPAISTRKATLIQANRFATKAGRTNPLSSEKSYVIKSMTGKNNKLRVTHGIKKSYTNFTEWAVCVCANEASIPKLKRARINPSRMGLNTEGALCSNDRSALFVRKKMR